MKKVLVLVAITALFLTACGNDANDSGEPVGVDTEVSVTVDPPVTADAEVSVTVDPVGPIPFSEVGMAMLSATISGNEEGYSEFPFMEGTGDCVDLGFPTEFSYIFDEGLGYNIVEGKGGLRDEYVGLGATGHLTLIDTGFTLEGIEGEPSCTAKSTTGENEATFSCKVEAEEEDAEDVVVCEATFNVYAVR